MTSTIFPPEYQIHSFLAVGASAEDHPQNSWMVALEFMHQSWYQQASYDLLEDYQINPVLHDKLQQSGHMLRFRL